MSKQTIIKKTSLTRKKVQIGLKNKAGMIFSNDPEVRKIIAEEVHKALRKIQGKL
jgi:hypothetical protein